MHNVLNPFYDDISSCFKDCSDYRCAWVVLAREPNGSKSSAKEARHNEKPKFQEYYHKIYFLYRKFLNFFPEHLYFIKDISIIYFKFHAIRTYVNIVL